LAVQELSALQGCAGSDRSHCRSAYRNPNSLIYKATDAVTTASGMTCSASARLHLDVPFDGYARSCVASHYLCGRHNARCSPVARKQQESNSVVHIVPGAGEKTRARGVVDYDSNCEDVFMQTRLAIAARGYNRVLR
jgi:hypothetical protein